MTIRTFCGFNSLMSVFLGFLLVGMSGCDNDTSSNKEISRVVYTTKIEPPSRYMYRSFSGVVKPSLQAVLSFRVDGKITELLVKNGMTVKQGDIIAKLDPTDYELEVQRLESQLQQAESQLNRARADYERTRILYEAKNVSKSVLDRDLSTYQTAKAQYETTEVMRSIVQQKLAYTFLHAPVDGNISSLAVEEFQTVKAGQPITTITSGDTFEIEVGVPESLISEIRMGDHADISLDVFPDKHFTGIISEVGITTAVTNTYPLMIKLVEFDERIRSGMVGEVTLRFQGDESLSLSIPSSAVVGTVGDKHHVWVYNPKTESVQKRSVQIGKMISSGIVIHKGLKPGEQVITRGVHQLDDGMKVQVIKK